MQPKTSSTAGWVLVILANLLIHLATALPPRANGLRAYRDESEDGAVREESVRHLDPIDGVHHFESEQELTDFLRQMEERMKNTNGKWKVEYRRYSSHSDGAGGGADGDVQTHVVDGGSSLLNGASMINCKRCTLKIRRVGNGEIIGGGGETTYVAGSTKSSSSDGRTSMTADDLLRNYGDVESINGEAGQVSRNVKTTKVVTTSTSGSRGYGSDGSMTVGDLLRNYGSAGERGSEGSGNVKVTKVVTSTNTENVEDFNAEEALARADEILRRYQNGGAITVPAGEGSRNVKVTQVVTTSGSTSGNSGSYEHEGLNSQVTGQSGNYGNTGHYGNLGGFGTGSRNVKVTKVTTTKTTGGSSGAFGTGRYINSGSGDELEALGNTDATSGVDGSRNVKVTRVITSSGNGGSTNLYSGGYGTGLTTQEGYGGIGDSSSGGQYNRNVKVTKVVTTSGSGGMYGPQETEDLLKSSSGSIGSVRVTNAYGGTTGSNENQGIVHGTTNYGTTGNVGSLGTSETSGQTVRKTTKITRSYWSGNTEIPSLIGDDTKDFDQMKGRLDELINSGHFKDGKTVTTVTTTTSTNGGPPVVKTERYIKDGVDMSLDMNSLGTLDTAPNSIYGHSQNTQVSSHGSHFDSGTDQVSGKTTGTTKKTVKITKSYWKGDTQLGSYDGASGDIDEELRRRLEEFRRNGDYQNGKTITTVTTTTSVNGGPPVVKTDRYVKDGYDTSFDLKTYGTLDTAANSIYGQTRNTASNHGISGETLSNLGGKTTETSRKTVKVTKTYWKGDTQVGSFSGSDNLDEELKRRLEGFKNDGNYVNGKTVTTVTTTTSTNGGPPVVKTERYVKDGFDTSLNMDSLGTLDTNFKSAQGESQILTSSHGSGNAGLIGGETSGSSRKTVKITKTYWKGSTHLGSLGDTDQLGGDLRARLEELIRNGEVKDGKTITTVTTTTSTNGGTPVVKTERYVKDGIDTSLHRDSFGSPDTSYGSTSDQSYSLTSSHGSDTQSVIQETGIGRTPARPGGVRNLDGSYGSTIQGSSIANQMNSNEFRTVLVGGEIQPDRNDRPTVIEAIPSGPARHARPEGPVSTLGESSHGSSSVHSTYTSGISEGSSGLPHTVNTAPNSQQVGSGNTYTKTYVSAYKTSHKSGSANIRSPGDIANVEGNHGVEMPHPGTGGSRVITTETDNIRDTMQHNVGRGSSTYSVTGSGEGTYDHGSSGRVTTSGHEINLPYSPAGVDGLYTRPDGVPVVSGSYFNSGRKTSDSITPESSIPPVVPQTGVTHQTAGHKVISSTTYTKHAESTSSGNYGGGSNTQWNSQSSADSLSSEEDQAYHGPVPTPSPSIKIGYGTGVGGYGGGGSRKVVSGSYSHTAGTSYGGSISGNQGSSGYSSGVKTVPYTSGYGSGSGYSSGGGYNSGGDYSSGGGYTGSGYTSGVSTSGSHYKTSGTYGSSMGGYGASGTNGDSTYSASRKVTTYGTGDCVGGTGTCIPSPEEESAGYVRQNPSYSYSQSWSSGSTYGRNSRSGVKGIARPEHFSQEEKADC